MRILRTYLSGIFLSFFVLTGLSASDIRDLGIPFLTHYNRQVYHASTQNWCVTQDRNNVMWFGNTAVILWFDGREWGQVGVPNGSVVRSLCTLADNTVLAGSFGDFGSIERNREGGYYYKSWLDKVPEKYRKFTDVWRIYELNNDVFIQTVERILVFRDGKFFGTLEPEHNFTFSYVSNGRFYADDKGAGLKVLMQNQLIPVENGDFFKDKEIWFLNHSMSFLMAGTQKDGIFIYRGGKWVEWNTPVNQLLKKNVLYSGIKNGHNGFIFGTVQNGIIFSDEQGNITRIINRKKGLQNNTVLSLSKDREGNLWAGLDQGIDYIEINSPFTRITKEDGFGTGYCSALSNGYLYLGTNQGVYYKRPESDADSDFKLLEGSQGQVWNFATMGDDLYCLHHNGLFRIEGEHFHQVAGIQGCWEIVPYPLKSGYYIMGTYNGLWGIHLENGSPKLWKLAGFDESSRVLVFDRNGELWMSHGYKGIYKIDLDTSDLKSITAIRYFGQNQGLPSNSNNEVFKVDGRVLFITTAGFYYYDDLTGEMKPYQKWNSILQFNGLITKVISDPWNRLDIFAGGRLTSVVLRHDSLLFRDSNTFLPLQNSFFEAFENITFISKDLSIIGTEDGFVLYDRQKRTNEAITVPLFIKRVSSYREKNYTLQHTAIPFIDEKVIIPYKDNNLEIETGVPYYQVPGNIRISCLLNGDTIRLAPGNRNINLTDLHEDSYRLSITVSDITGFNFPTTHVLDFTVKPPWFRTWYAYLAYLLILALITLTIIYWARKNIERVRRKEKIRQQRKMIRHEISLRQQAMKAEQEMIRMKNETLESENRMKAREIANSTMQLVHKNQMLLNVRENLKAIQKENDIDTRNNRIRSMLKGIDKDLNNDENWKIFEKNFEEVHENFLNRFKEKHPQITASDMRLCAYLRMNLSSKEIAPLLRISARSVEISRYRLRKKLNLPHETNLTDYILHF